MRRESLISLLRLRQQGVASAKRDLADCMAREAAAHARAEAADRLIIAEAEAAADLAAADEIVESYARWLPVGRSAAVGAREAADCATEAVDHSRASLQVARAAEQLAANALSEADRLLEAGLRLKEQNELDDRAPPPA